MSRKVELPPQPKRFASLNMNAAYRPDPNARGGPGSRGGTSAPALAPQHATPAQPQRKAPVSIAPHSQVPGCELRVRGDEWTVGVRVCRRRLRADDRARRRQGQGWHDFDDKDRTSCQRPQAFQPTVAQG